MFLLPSYFILPAKLLVRGARGTRLSFLDRDLPFKYQGHRDFVISVDSSLGEDKSRNLLFYPLLLIRVARVRGIGGD